MASDAAGIHLVGSSHPQHKPPPYVRVKTTCTQSSTSSAGSSHQLPPPYPSSSPSSPSCTSSSINDKAESVGDKQSNGKPTAAPLRPRYIKNRKDKRANVEISSTGIASPSTYSSVLGSAIVTDV